MPGKFVVFKGEDGPDHFRLKARNGEVRLSGEGFRIRKSRLNGVEPVARSAADAVVVCQA